MSPSPNHLIKHCAGCTMDEIPYWGSFFAGLPMLPIHYTVNALSILLGGGV